MLGGADRQPLVLLPGRGVQPGQARSVGQPAAAFGRRQADPGLHACDDMPAGVQDRRDQVIAREVAVEADDAAGEQAGAAAGQAGEQRLLPGPGPARDRPEHRTAGARGQGDDPELRERRGSRAVLGGGAGAAEHRPVRRRVRHVHEHPVGSAHHHPGQQHRRRVIIRDQRPGCQPEQGLHQAGRHQHPPVRDDLLRGYVPFQGERDVREQPGQPGQRLAVRPVGHQRHREHQPDDQRVRHDPPPQPLPQPALLQRRGHDLLDHPVAEMALQLAQPHEIRQPAIRPHAAVPPDQRRGGHHRPAEHRQLAPRRRRARRDCRLPAVRPQASGPHHDRPRRSPGCQGLRCPACINDGRQI